MSGTFPRDPGPLKAAIVRGGGKVAHDISYDRIDVVVLGDRSARAAREAERRGLAIVTAAELIVALADLDSAHAAALRKVMLEPVGPMSPKDLASALHAADPELPATAADLVAQALDNDVVVHLGLAGSRATPAPSWLLAWCSDADGCELYVIPEAVVDERRRADLMAVRGLCFANGSDAAPRELGAAIRLLAGATFVGNRSPAELAARLHAGWANELRGVEAEAQLHSAADLEPWIGWLEPYHAGSIEDLRGPFSQIVAVNQAM